MVRLEQTGRRPRRARRAVAGLRVRRARHLRRRRHVRDACPVGINTGALVKQFRGERHSAAAQAAGGLIARRFAIVESMVKAGLRAGHVVQRLLRRTRDAGHHGRRRVASPGRRCRYGHGPCPGPRRRSRVASVMAQWPCTCPPACRVYSAPGRASRCRSRCPRPSSSSPPGPASRCGSRMTCTARAAARPSRPRGSRRVIGTRPMTPIERCWAWSDSGRLPIVVDANSCTARAARMRPVAHVREPGTAGRDATSWTAWSSPTAPCCRAWPWCNRVRSVAVHPTCSLAQMGSADELVARRCRLRRAGRASCVDCLLRLCRRSRLPLPGADCLGDAGGGSGSASRQTATTSVSANRMCEVAMSGATGTPLPFGVAACSRKPRGRSDGTLQWGGSVNVAAPAAPRSV